MNTKICTKCKVTFDATPEYFRYRKEGKYGLSAVCRTCHNQYKREWRDKNKDRENEKNREYRLNKIDEVRNYQKQYRKRVLREVKEQVFNGYGYKCVCCGENRYEFLTIDHINGDGHLHRKENGATSSFRTVNVYKDIIRKGFPDSIRILCFNCHMSVDVYGCCPHGKIRREYEKNNRKK